MIAVDVIENLFIALRVIVMVTTGRDLMTKRNSVEKEIEMTGERIERIRALISQYTMTVTPAPLHPSKQNNVRRLFPALFRPIL